MFRIDRVAQLVLPFSRSQDRVPPPKRGAGGWPHGGGAKSPRPPGENTMVAKQIPVDDEILRAVAAHREATDKLRRQQAHERAAARCLLRDDVTEVEIRPDGTLLCTDYEGRQTLRPAGWRGRS